MKKTLVLLTCVAAVSAYSQGTVSFVTRDTGNGVNSAAFYTNSTEIGPVSNGAKPNPTVSIANADGNWGGVNARAGLYGGPNGTDNLVLLVPAVGFRSGAAAGYVDPGSDPARTVAGIPGGALASFQVRAWDTGTVGVETYEAAAAISLTRKVYLGQTLRLDGITLGNFIPPGGAPTPSAPLTGLNGGVNFAMDYVGVPEPSIIGLGILGAVAGLLVFRRRN